VKGSSRHTRHRLGDIDITKPNIARVYNYFVGGKDNISQEERVDFRNRV
jgi:S-adenosyl methyltransferase